MISVFEASVFVRYMAANQQRMSSLGRCRFALHVVRQFAVSKLRREICSVAGIGAEQLSVELIGVRASWVMDGAKVLPEPGAENDWLKQKS